jgi:branched-chain amino acid transport system permease protein
MMAMVIVGGMGTMIGPVIGAVVLTFLPELLRGIGELRLMVYGLALTLVVLFLPGGIVQGWNALRARLAGAQRR